MTIIQLYGLFSQAIAEKDPFDLFYLKISALLLNVYIVRVDSLCSDCQINVGTQATYHPSDWFLMNSPVVLSVFSQEVMNLCSNHRRERKKR